ncbi:MAG TPA: hypothetical protein VH307_31260 [Streptosporangiaceae bacterium]|jgi:hypothetical protein|nr:hypothetical protein [Streptosporangiaceae bacterium]
MAASTGPVVAAGVITYANNVVGNGRSWDSQLIILVGTGLAAGMLALAERGTPQLAVGIAWIALITSLLITPKKGRSAIANLTSMTGL